MSRDLGTELSQPNVLQNCSPRERFVETFLQKPLYALPAQEILKAVDRKDPFSSSYLAMFPALLTASQNFASLFPSDVANGMAAGGDTLISDALYAIAHHTDHANSTDSVISLRGSNQLPVTYTGPEPAELLNSLRRAMTRIHSVATDPAMVVVKSVDAQYFRIYRFIDPFKIGAPAVHLYIRPTGSEQYDPMYEYGRPNSGVEASISYVTDSRSGEELAGIPFLGELTKNHYGPRPDRRISLRLDREGVRPEDRELLDGYHHPQLHQGTMSYDAGSVLGQATGGTLPLGTRIGRLLAWGNVLASNENGKLPGLNHSTEMFDSRHGQCDVFARNAGLLESELTLRAVSQKSLKQMYGLKNQEMAK